MVSTSQRGCNSRKRCGLLGMVRTGRAGGYDTHSTGIGIFTIVVSGVRWCTRGGGPDRNFGAKWPFRVGGVSGGTGPYLDIRESNGEMVDNR